MTHATDNFAEDLATTLVTTKAGLCCRQRQELEAVALNTRATATVEPPAEESKIPGDDQGAPESAGRSCASRETLPMGFTQLPPGLLPSTVTCTTTNSTTLDCQWSDGRRVQVQLGPHTLMEALKELLLLLAQGVIHKASSGVTSGDQLATGVSSVSTTSADPEPLVITADLECQRPK
ncbi:hypothetical protein Vafri_5423 [Volvox africanus]|uniref:Uncharacterized protein n=1 Tax=Volvox africanus TaxID=51714 RepID=A0A8J4AWB5_9CHLO|nr:hypothetical protein Vafri_5423 [Volvox africanus]